MYGARSSRGALSQLAMIFYRTSAYVLLNRREERAQYRSNYGVLGSCPQNLAY